MFRLMQFWGSYRGNHEHRQLSNKMKEIYFYPRKIANGSISQYKTPIISSEQTSQVMENKIS